MIVGVCRPTDDLADLADLVAGPVVVCHGTVGDWAPRPGDGVDWLDLLGADAPRYLAMPPGEARDRFAAARRLLKHVCAVRLGVEPASMTVGYEPRGRPFLVGTDQPHVSISHTRDLVAVAVNDSGPVGVDVEHGDRPLLDETLLSRACTPSERAALRSVPPGQRNRRAVQLWTLKESYAKALGEGLALDFRQIGFTLRQRDRGLTGQPRLQATATVATGSPPRAWRFQLAAVPGGYTSACSVRTGHGSSDREFLPVPSRESLPVPPRELPTSAARPLTTANLTRSTT